MTKPDGIPQDVWQQAEAALFDGSSNVMKIIEAIARAIMAEREACAQRFLTYSDKAAEGHRALDFPHITNIVGAIRNRGAA